MERVLFLARVFCPVLNCEKKAGAPNVRRGPVPQLLGGGQCPNCEEEAGAPTVRRRPVPQL
jgi:hypothetical protein